eukprot:TRINITY_DN20565_c0_g1_i3.p1 TRINITY_DN20565_c0_g1~~TRINITY_DN20565_c0_g1_i3.p1  ORF type:complete len:234 (-),score=43.93 TRINITY_DN20565_c0_g1_i3:464-1165(-)
MTPSPQPCTLLNNTFGVLVQLLLALICFSSLLIKWQLEIPRRSTVVWVLDSAKQGFSALCAHGTALVVAMFMNQDSRGSQCSWYFLIFCVDTSVGVTIAYLLLKTVEHFAGRAGWETLEKSGDYGQFTAGHEIRFRVWGLQMVVWCFLTVLARMCCGLLVWLSQEPLSDLVILVDRPFEGNPAVMLAVVMLVGPIGMNVVQLWVQDNFLKTSNKGYHLVDHDSSGAFDGADCL